ncbi:uncharacterized protein LOC126653793 [Mercurialis annua]|uniref:uncharacterized protein LOC126653793 n=1 Tax=Mercurialis annua TaxID=3986 RepID=UPI00215FD947|nr:uncharacterized protein LOC126653793 [Mercurialis annua]
MCRNTTKSHNRWRWCMRDHPLPYYFEAIKKLNAAGCPFDVGQFRSCILEERMRFFGTHNNEDVEPSLKSEACKDEEVVEPSLKSEACKDEEVVDTSLKFSSSDAKHIPATMPPQRQFIRRYGRAASATKLIRFLHI